MSFTYRSKCLLDCSVTPVSMMGHVPAGSSCVSQHPLHAVQASQSPSFAVMGTLRDFGFLDFGLAQERAFP